MNILSGQVRLELLHDIDRREKALNCNIEYEKQQLKIDADRLQHFKSTNNQAKVDFYQNSITKRMNLIADAEELQKK